jgi:hypothetical protein
MPAFARTPCTWALEEYAVKHETGRYHGRENDSCGNSRFPHTENTLAVLNI